MPALYVQKLSSLNPDRFIFIRLEEALIGYHYYLQIRVDMFLKGYPKSFSSWLDTEI